MHYTRKIPFMLSAFMTIVVGAASMREDIAAGQIYIRMIISIIVFFAVGVFISNTIKVTRTEIEEKELMNRLAAAAAELKSEEPGGSADTAGAGKPGMFSSTTEFRGLDSAMTGSKPEAGRVVNLVSGDLGEDFEPLKVSEVIRTQIKE